MTIANYVRAGIVGLALMAGCKYEAPQRSEYDFKCGRTNDSKSVCATFDGNKKLTSFSLSSNYSSIGNCFYTVGHEDECAHSGKKSHQMSPSLEKAANDFFRGQNELAFGIDKAIYDLGAEK